MSNVSPSITRTTANDLPWYFSKSPAGRSPNRPTRSAVTSAAATTTMTAANLTLRATYSIRRLRSLILSARSYLAISERKFPL